MMYKNGWGQMYPNFGTMNWRPGTSNSGQQTAESMSPANQPEQKPIQPNTSATVIGEDDILAADPVMTAKPEDTEDDMEGNEMKGRKNLISSAELTLICEELEINSPTPEEFREGLLDLARTVCLKSDEATGFDLASSLRDEYGISMLESLKIAQAFVQPTIEETEMVLARLPKPQSSANPVTPATNTDNASQNQAQDDQNQNEGSQNSGQNEQNQNGRQDSGSDQGSQNQDNKPDKSGEVDLNLDVDDFLNDFFGNEDEENGTQEQSAQTKEEISYEDFRATVAADMSFMVQSRFYEVQNMSNSMAEFIIERIEDMTPTKWDNLDVLGKASASHVKAYCEYLLDTQYTVADYIGDEDGNVSVKCLVCESPDKIPAVFRKICEDNPEFSFADAKYEMRQDVIYGNLITLNVEELQRIYNNVKKIRDHNNRDQNVGANSSGAYNAWQQANGEGDGFEEPTPVVEGEIVEDDDSGDPRFARPKKSAGKVIGIAIAIVVILAMFVGAVFFFWKVVGPMFAKDEEWTEPTPMVEPIPEETIDEETDKAEEAPAADQNDGQDNNQAGTGLESAATDKSAEQEDADTEAATKEDSSDDNDTDDGIVVTAVAAEPGSAFDLPANQYGAFDKQSDGVYTCLAKVTPDQAQTMLNEMKKNNESSHLLRYICMPESGLIMTHSISLEVVEQIVAGEGDGFSTTFDETVFVNDQVTENTDSYTVCKRMKLDEIKSLIDSSQPTDELVYYQSSIVMITDNYAATEFEINRSALVNIYHAMKDIGAKEVAGMFIFSKDKVAEGNVASSDT